MKKELQEDAINFAIWKDKEGWQFEGILFRRATGNEDKPYEYMSTDKLYQLYLGKSIAI